MDSNSSQISQVQGCDFTTEELQQFHRYYKYDWPESLANSSLVSKIDHFSTQEPSVDTERLRRWLRTMGIQDESELTPEQQLYSRFEAFDFTTAPGFNEFLTKVYMPGTQANKHDIEERMERAKAEYYNSRVEKIDYDRYSKHKEETKPKPVCPYQHLWEKEKQGTANNSQFEHVKIIDLADHVDGKLTAEALENLNQAVEDAADPQYYALAIMRTQTDDAVFLPALDNKTSESSLAALRACLRLEIALRRLNADKPVIMFANGAVDPTSLGIIHATTETVLSENFCVEPSTAQFPTSIYSWAHLGNATPGTAEYILCHPAMTIRGSEWQGALELGRGFVGHRKFADAAERILLAASCPPPQTRNALRQACLVESAYPGPCKITVWKNEITQYFAPLAQETDKNGSVTSLDKLNKLVKDLGALGKPWAEKYIAFADSADQMKKRAVWIAALEAARKLEYSQALALEYSLAKAILAGECETAETAQELVGRIVSKGPSIADIISINEAEMESRNENKAETQPNALQVEIPGECPFAKMYRKNPQQFQHIDLKSISNHKPLNLDK
ncbi:hypothetical protein H4R99_000546 [Coemansia sp. RSA 1722]|nr:hypothetical protein LPJ57_001842 [Coemansia sp. RSA 486]KAJ2238090.1 hypothetical protein IWW45_000430 [Coemansia sp. RSA 485]KAJ2603549.1 hypothetical protein GGF39_000042 [Coemansia sp. RSA 1721]KAJ2606151.1 hypothetical protein H4R99_000546 [Coemansia sp. RSA 1722]KAJ2638700.1 hypothetical protein GGF40_001476 [Coemansia sp. RSA 1286]